MLRRQRLSTGAQPSLKGGQFLEFRDLLIISVVLTPTPNLARLASSVLSKWLNECLRCCWFFFFYWDLCIADYLLAISQFSIVGALSVIQSSNHAITFIIHAQHTRESWHEQQRLHTIHLQQLPPFCQWRQTDHFHVPWGLYTLYLLCFSTRSHLSGISSFSLCIVTWQTEQKV